MAAAPAGYSEYFIPGDEEDLIVFHNTVNNTAFTENHSVVTVTAWAPDTVIYYDHWENGYYFDPQDPEKTDPGYPGPGNHSYDEKFTLARGESRTLESDAIPAVSRNPANIFYDGRDKVYAIGGTVAVNRVTWPTGAGTVEAIGLEVYPVRPQLTTYIMPLGEELAGAPVSNPDFERVFALVQATTDGTVVQFDLDGDGVVGDSICTSRDWPTCIAGTATEVSLNAGECFLLDRYSSSPTTGDPGTTAGAQLLNGSIIQGNNTLQVHYLFCDRLTNYNSRGVSAFPTGFWDDQYYAPVGSDTGYDNPTDIFLYNPHSTQITINYESQAGSGSFTVDPHGTASYHNKTLAYATQDSATYLRGSEVFWGISSIDSGGSAYDWSYSLIPATFLTDEYFIGWAPGAYADPNYPAYPITTDNYDDSGLFITAAQDNVHVFIDRNSDGTSDEDFTLTHLQSRYVYDPVDGDMSQSNIWATGPITLAYGQNPQTAVTGRPAIDTGDAIIPGIDFVDLVLSVDKSTSPVMVSTSPGSQATYTLVVKSAKYTVDDVSVVDSLPAGWEYAGPTLITFADQTTSTTAPVLSGDGDRTLTWAGLGNMAENQEITIAFKAQTDGTVAFNAGDMTRNYVEAIGTRIVGNPQVTQTFTTSDFVFNSFSSTASQMDVQKTSSAVDPLSPGDSFTYTVTVTNNGTSTLNDVAIYDPRPTGLSYVANSARITTAATPQAYNVRDEFASVAYNLNAGTENWSGDWTETDSLGGGAASGLVSVTGNQLQFAYTNSVNTVSDTFSTVSYSNNDGTRNWSGDWSETDIPQYTGGATNGDALVTNNTLRLTYVASNVADNFTTSSYARNDGTLNWMDTWDETGDNDLPGNGSITVDTPNADVVTFGVGAAGRSIQRTAPVSGTDVTITFALGDSGIDNGEGIIADYSLNGGSSWTEITRNNNNNVTGNVTISTAGATSLILRFTTYGTYTGNDEATVDTVNIAYLAAGAQVARTVDLTGETAATLTFDFNLANIDGGGTPDRMVVEASSSPSGPFTVLETYGNGTAAGSKTYNIASYISAATTIRFRVTNNLNVTDEYFSVDNATISYSHYVSAVGSQIVRQAVLSGLTSDPATLTFSFGRNALEAGDTLVVEANANGSGFMTLATYDSGTATGNKSIVISSYKSPVTDIRFRVTGGVNDTGEYFSIDNVDIAYTSLTTHTAAHTPPNYIVSSDNYDLSSGSSLTLTYNVTVDNPLATGIDSITNSACVTSTEYLVPVCAEVTNVVSNPSSGTAQVGDIVWFDANGDGIKDVSENGLANVEVTLKDKYGAPLATKTTDATGRFLFTGIAPGTGYYVQVTGGLPAGLVQTYPLETAPPNNPRNDDRTNAFNLSAGQNYMDADLGYKSSPGTAVIGDLVWSDADGDGIRDPGEPGLGGIRVRLYTDSDGDGVIDGGEPYVETTTGPDGSYLFTGVAASGTEDYIVWVDPAQAVLSAYDITKPASGSFSLINVAASASVLYADSGFKQKAAGTTFSIQDKVWLDTDADGTKDTGENGIAGVTVALLDAASNVIATATTDSNGDFQFTGVPGNKNYSWRITDQSGILSNYYGITPSALAGKYQMTGSLIANLDYTTAPHFGYNVSRSIGDTVFNDIDGNGVQDSGEPGISGVTVALYRDTNGNGLLDGGEPLAATLDTDANGNYLFSGLANGNYIVSIASSPSGYTYTTESPDNDPAAGDQQPASILLGVSVLNIDFGYWAATQRTVSGTVWNDANVNGLPTGESGIAGVTIALLNGSGTVVATTTTDSNGYYEFTGQPSGTYTVKVTDTNGILTDYSTTYEFTEKFAAGSYNGQEAVDLSSGDASLIDFGYANPRVTSAVIGEFGVFNEGGKVVVRWQTVSEEGTLGFYLYRLDEKTGREKRINNKLLPGFLHSPVGGYYSYEDKPAKTGAYYTYRLEEVEAGGNRISYGPWTVFTGTSLSNADSAVELETNAAVSGFKQAEQPVSRKTKERRDARKEARLKAQTLKESRKGIQAKISVTEEGLYFVNAGDIAAVLNKTQDEAARLIQTNKVRLRNKGQSVAVLPASDNSGLYFYGEKLETRYTDENIYWLDVQKATLMNRTNDAPQGLAGDSQSFRQEVREEESHYAVADLFEDPKADFWMWDYVFPEYGRNQVSLSVFTPGVVAADAAMLTVALQGGSEAFVGNDHHAIISVNGFVVGDTQWDGITASIASFPVDAGILKDGVNSVEISGIKESGVPYDIFYVNYLTVEYSRHYTADDNHLAAENNGYDTMVIDGFTDPDIFVFDITDPLRPKLLSGAEIEIAENNAGEYQVRFQTVTRAGRKTVNQSGRYLVVAMEAIKPCELVADQPSSLSSRSNRGNYLIITSSDLAAAAQDLADYRSGQGYKSMVVDVEDIYDEFTYGIRDAEAIRAFLKFAYGKWRTRPKYVLLAGEGSFDCRDYMGFGDSIVPPLLTATPEGLFVTDNLYADVAGDDGIPEFSIGRIPVVNAEEFLNYTSKVIGYESSGGNWTTQAVLAADIPDTGGNFPASSEEVAGLFPDDFMIDRIYLDAMPLATAKADFLADINEGRAFVNFIGHGGLTLIGNTNLFSSGKIAQLHNGDRLPVMTAMTCLSGNFGYPGLDSLSESMVLGETGGAAAMWSPSGFALNHYSVQLCKGFYGAVFSPGAKTLGDAILSSLKGYAASGENLYYLNLYNLMGDPALVIK